jgi:uncharacterized protein (TIGR02453 family)
MQDRLSHLCPLSAANVVVRRTYAILPPMRQTFTGFSPTAFGWFAGLERDNSREYFHGHRDVYEAEIRGPLRALLEELSESFGGEPRLFRPQRDVRFAAGQPYKTRAYAILEGTPSASAGLYAEVSARGLFAGAGYAFLARDQLARFREAVADEAAGPALEQAVAGALAAGLELPGEGLRTAPRGYARDHPRIELLRRLSVVAGARLAGDGGITAEAGREHVAGAWRAAAPLAAWLDEHVGRSELPSRYERGRA